MDSGPTQGVSNTEVTYGVGICLEMDRTSTLGISMAALAGFWSALGLGHPLTANRSAPP